MDKRKIALLEDDEILSKVLFEELQDAGFDVSRAIDGKQGLEIIKAEKPDLVLLDIVMPAMNGFEIIKKLKSSYETKNIPIVILSVLGDDEDIKKGLKLGADDYIVKSQHPIIEIVDKVKDFFAKKQNSRAKNNSKEKK